MSPPPLLTIAIPTYNRLDCLRLLLDAVAPEIDGLRASGIEVELLVSNNASTDGSTEELRALSAAGRLRLVDGASNIGADGNIIRCLLEARGRHVWIFGDDDLPLPGVVARVAAFLREREPDLLYVAARWHEGDLSLLPRTPPSQRQPHRVDAMELALAVGAYTTFLSSWVVHRERYLSLPGADPHRFQGTSLAQLEWNLGLLAAGRDLFAAPGHWLLARAGNSGGYALFETFVARYHAILGEKLRERPRVGAFLQDQLLIDHLPGLVWGMRLGALGRFDPMDWREVDRMMAQAWPQRPSQRAWVTRIARWPRPLAWLAMGWCWLRARWWKARMRLAQRSGS